MVCHRINTSDLYHFQYFPQYSLIEDYFASNLTINVAESLMSMSSDMNQALKIIKLAM